MAFTGSLTMYPGPMDALIFLSKLPHLESELQLKSRLIEFAIMQLFFKCIWDLNGTKKLVIGVYGKSHRPYLLGL